MTHRAEFRDLLFPIDSPRLASFRGMDPHAFGREAMKADVPAAMAAEWKRLYAQPYACISCDGHKQAGLFHIADEGAPTGRMVSAANDLLAALSPAERAAVRHPIDAPE